MDEFTTTIPILDTDALLIREKTGIGAGKIGEAGGAVEPGEAPEAAAVREVREELRIEPTGVEKVGEFGFHLRDDSTDEDSMFVHAFRADGFDGTPEETDEAVPVWFPTADLPFAEMWPTDRIWVPHLLAGETFSGEFVVSDDGASLVEYEVEVGVTFEE
jgi:8-oxo-dGTP diphosphatase